MSRHAERVPGGPGAPGVGPSPAAVNVPAELPAVVAVSDGGSHLRVEEAVRHGDDGPLERQQQRPDDLEAEVPVSSSGRHQRDQVGDAQQRDDDQEGLGRLPVLPVGVRPRVRTQLANHHL